MPTANPLVVQAPPMSYIFLDKDTGLPMTSGFVFFYRDSARTEVKPVYELASDYTYSVLSDPLQLGANGAFVDANGNQIVIYLYPYLGSPSDVTPSNTIDLYYVQIYSTQNVFQQSIAAWPAGVNTKSLFTNVAETDNLLSNPQFSTVNFNPLVPNTITLTTSPQTSNIAPGWDLVTTGTGTVTVQQVASTDPNIPSNPPYYLNISSTGISEPIVLRQRLYNSPRLLVDGFICGYFTVASTGTSQIPITMSYVASGGTPTTFPIATVTTPASGDFVDTSNVVSTIEIDPTTPNPDSPNTVNGGYVDIIISIPVSANTVSISSIQVSGVISATTRQPFLQQPVARETDHLFHNYFNSLVMQPKSTILSGWDFALNPWQFQPIAQTTLTLNQYACDQTIVVQQNYVNGGPSSNISVGQGSFSVNQALQITAVTATNKFAIIQYLDPKTVRPYWTLSLSSLVNAAILTTNSTTCRIKMRLIWRSNAVPTIAQNEPISTWSSTPPTSEPLFSGGWTAVKPLNDPEYTLGATNANYTFDLMTLPSATTSTMMFGIVIYTLDNLSITGTPDSIVFNKVSLVPNEFAMDTQPKTYDTVLRECQFYYETSYPTESAIASTTWGAINRNQILIPQYAKVSGSSTQCIAAAWQLSWNSLKRTLPNGDIFDPATGAANNARAWLYPSNGSANSNPITFNTVYHINYDGTKGYSFIPQYDTALVSLTSIDNVSAYIAFHYTSDARLGIVL
ncbi:MAG: hypothetical protein EPO02_12765 [Nitrospirae bacterium]|nr:MAG: hypothetical protein EPO02_12765 [Nitrospirota bacterium]